MNWCLIQILKHRQHTFLHTLPVMLPLQILLVFFNNALCFTWVFWQVIKTKLLSPVLNLPTIIFSGFKIGCSFRSCCWRRIFHNTRTIPGCTMSIILCRCFFYLRWWPHCLCMNLVWSLCWWILTDILRLIICEVGRIAITLETNDLWTIGIKVVLLTHILFYQINYQALFNDDFI